MKLVADESVDLLIVERLRLDGHDIIYIAEQLPSVSDEIVLSLSNNHQALLLTADKDFGELVFRQNQVHGGVVLIRLLGISSEAKAEIISQVFQAHEVELAAAFSVVSPGTVRIRKLGN